MFDGLPNYPDASRFWQVIDKHKVNIFYTAPTAIRALMREGEAPVKKTSRASLRLLGSVGEPINPEAWLWYNRVVGDGRRSEEHTSELQSLMRISYDVFCLKQHNNITVSHTSSAQHIANHK